MKTYRSYSSAETKKFGYKLAKKLANGKWPASPKRERGRQRAGSKKAAVFALTGELGSGKTTFVQGFFLGLGIKRRATSPTFIIFRRFRISGSSVPPRPRSGRGSPKGGKGQVSSVRSVYHVDAYRIKKPSELDVLGLKEILRDPQNIVLIEWAENIKEVLPKSTIWLKFHHGRKENERIVKC